MDMFVHILSSRKALQFNEKLTKPIIETKYLNVENTGRYRTILRFFFLQYEKLKYWMYQEEIYEELISHEYFSDYTIEKCQQDLSYLVECRNLITMQDTKKVNTIEEFKNKKFRYQLSEYTVEIERLVIRLENLFIEGASLEPTLLERIRKSLSLISMKQVSNAGEKAIDHMSVDETYQWWNELNTDFKRLNQNYQDYMRDLNSVRAEEMMKTKEFLMFKDKLIDYLRSFVKSLQMNTPVIEKYIKNAEQHTLKDIFNKVLEYELSIPRLEAVDEKALKERMEGRWESIKEWFGGAKNNEAEAGKVYDAANEIIRKITRYASRISELSSSGANRKEEYAKAASLFYECSDIKEAHKLSAYLFGIDSILHLKGDFARKTESINSGVYEEEANVMKLNPRIRNYREKSKKSAIRDRSSEKEAMKQAALKRMEEEKKLLDSYITDNEIDFSNLPVIEPQVRNIFLSWLSKAFENKKFTGRTEDGRTYKVLKPNAKERCILECSDGLFEMPCYKIVFDDG